MNGDEETDLDDIESQVRQFLVAALSPEDLQRLDELVAAIEEQGPPQLDEDGEVPDGAVMVDDIKDHLEECLTPEQMRFLEHLIGELDGGPDAAARRERVGQLKQAAQRRKENTMTMAQDEALDLRRQLRDAGVPVGPRGDVATLRRLADAYGLRHRGMTMDASPLPARLSFDRMHPGLRARWARLEGSGMFAVIPDAGERGRSVTGGMAMDSGVSAATASVDRVWRGVCNRIAAR